MDSAGYQVVFEFMLKVEVDRAWSGLEELQVEERSL
jgi:hypothetical protein